MSGAIAVTVDMVEEPLQRNSFFSEPMKIRPPPARRFQRGPTVMTSRLLSNRRTSSGTPHPSSQRVACRVQADWPGRARSAGALAILPPDALAIPRRRSPSVVADSGRCGSAGQRSFPVPRLRAGCGRESPRIEEFRGSRSAPMTDPRRQRHHAVFRPDQSPPFSAASTTSALPAPDGRIRLFHRDSIWRSEKPAPPGGPVQAGSRVSALAESRFLPSHRLTLPTTEFQLG